MDSEPAEKYIGMMPDEYDATRWNEDLSKIAVDLSKKSGISFEEHQDPFRLVRTWENGQETHELVVENEKIRRNGQNIDEERVTVWALSGMPFDDLKKGKPIPQEAKVWGICLPFAPRDVDRRNVLTMVDNQLSNGIKTAKVLQ